MRNDQYRSNQEIRRLTLVPSVRRSLGSDLDHIRGLIRRQFVGRESIEWLQRDKLQGNVVARTERNARKTRVPQVLAVCGLVIRRKIGPDVTTPISSSHREFNLASRLGSDRSDAKDLAAWSMRELELALTEDFSQLGNLERSELLRHFGSRGSSASASSSTVEASPTSSSSSSTTACKARHQYVVTQEKKRDARPPPPDCPYKT